MPAPRSPRRARLAILVSVALAITGFQLLVAAPAAQAVSPGLVISEAYGGGGNSGATYKNDFIELYNYSNAPISVAGMSVQYRSATGTGVASATALTGSVPAHGYYLVQEAAGTGGTTSLPTPDATGAIAMSGTAFTVYLANTTTALTLPTGSVTNNAQVIDLVGSNSNTFEGTTAAAVSNTTSTSRNTASADTDSNSSDFSSGAPTPTNTVNNVTPLLLGSVADQTGTVGKPFSGLSFTASGGVTPYTYSATGLPDGLSVAPSTGAVSGTPTTTCTCSVTAKVTDNASTVATQTFTFTVNSFSLTNPGDKSFLKDEAITPFTIATSGGTSPFSFQVTAGSLPAGLSLNAATGEVTGTPTAAQAATGVTVQATDHDGLTASTSFNITVGNVLAIADIQGTNVERSPFAPASGTGQGTDTVTTKGVITALYNGGFAASGAATCGFCGFYLQTGGSGGASDATPGASDGVFVFASSSFAGKDKDSNVLHVGDSVRVSGRVSEFSGTGDTGSLTEINATPANITTIAALTPVTMQTTLPATYADREAHEGELFQPTDLVITDTFNFESFGELGLAQGSTLKQPDEGCLASDSACIAAAQTDIKNRGWFVEDGTSTTFASGANFFRPKNSNNSDIPLPYIDKTHSARVGASVTYPAGGVLDYRNKKWYVQVPRAVLSTHNGDPDLGTDVLSIEDTRPQNTAPADVLHGTGDLKIATYNVENYFNIVGQDFADANPYYASSGPGCEWDYDRNDVKILTFQCTSPMGVPDAWDPVTNAPTHYHPGLVNAPRGAATQDSLDRQTAKIVTAINGLGADVVSLEELANVNKLRMGVTNDPLHPDPNKADGGQGTPIAWRDASIAYLVNHLNAAAPPGTTWGFVASPAESTDATPVNHLCSTKTAAGNNILPTATAGTCSWASGQDVIRSGFLYRKQTIVPVGQSSLDLPGLNGAPVPSPFDNAREPLAQFFKPVGHPNSDGFAVIVNHFKSKGDAGTGDGGGPATGDNANTDLLGAFNGDRTRQAGELLRFANWFAGKWDTDRVFLVGDFNAYTGESPIQTILNDPDNVDSLNFHALESDDPSDTTYDFTTTVDGIGYGGTGSLDHVFASDGALGMVTGKDVWEINANEPGAYNYSRYNTNKTDFWDPTVPFAGSDHNPFIIGIAAPANPNPVRDIQIIGANDFHGRLLGDASDGGAAQLAGAVTSLKGTYGDANSVFVSGGDNVGASIFESFTAKDKPAIDALNAAGLEFSSIGNHEFDKGWHDLTDRIMNPADPFGDAHWKYLGANVVHDGGADDGQPIVAPWAVKDFGDTGVGGDIKVGFIGGVTNDLPGLVSPSSLTGVRVDPLVQSVNSAAADLKSQHPDVDLIVLLVHEGAANTDCAQMLGAGNAYANLLNGIDPSIDAVLSGHTHLEYSCSFPVASWGGPSHPITERPVMQAASYGLALDQLVYEFDSSGTPVSVVQNNVNVKGAVSTLFNYPEDPAVKTIVDQAVAAAAGPGAVVLGRIAGPFKRARLADGTTENRGGESTLGNQVAEMQRWATSDAQHGSAQIAFMNPGGLRADLNGTGETDPRDVTYRQAADVQPFANELINKQMTGAQLREVLEQQWQRDASGNVPSRPFLRLGSSAGFTYTYDETADPLHPGATVGHVTAMYLNGVQLDDATTYSVTMNGFLADGGDNFTAFTEGTDALDTALSDLEAQVAYLKANANPTPLAVSFAQHAVKVHFPAAAPASYDPGATVSFDVSSLAMTGVGDQKDANLKVMLGGQELGTFPVDNTLAPNQPYDNAGTASVTVTLPADQPDGPVKLHLLGVTTGTDAIVPITVDDGLPDPTVSADDVTVPFGSAAQVPVTVDPADADGTVSVLDGATVLGSATLVAGSATVTIPADRTGAMGDHALSLAYSGEPGAFSPATGSFTLTVGKALSTTAAPDVQVTYGQPVPVEVTVTGAGATPSGSVELFDGATSRGTATLDGAGKATITVPARTFPVGARSLSVVYSGDASHLGSDHTLTATTVKATPLVTAADVSGVYGSPLTVKVNVSGPSGTTPSGTVAIRRAGTTIGTGTVSGGVASIVVAGGVLPVGDTALTASYSGDASFGAGTAAFTAHVSKAASTITCEVTPTRLKPAHDVGLTVTVRGANGLQASGQVQVAVEGRTLTAALVSGQAKFNLGSFRKGKHTATVTYGGSATLAGSQTTVTFTVS